MRNEYLTILEQEANDHSHKDLIMSYANRVIDYYESNRASTATKFTALLELCSFESMATIHKNDTPHVELFYGMDNLTFIGGVCGYYREEIGDIVVAPPKELNYYAREFQQIEDVASSILDNILFIWLCTIWQDIEGHKHGTVVKTMQNNSMTQFFFNDLAWGQLSDFYEYNNREQRVSRTFNRDLTIFEIYQRIRFINYPVNPYRNRWLKFVKGAETIEIGAWANSIAIRKNSEDITIEDKTDLKKRMIHVKNTRNTLLNNGYTEVDYHDHKEQIHSDAIEFNFHSGIGWYKKELSNRLDDKSIIELQDALNIELPHFFKQYLKLFNGRKFNKHRTKFRLDEEQFVKVTEFYSKDEIIQFNAATMDGAIDWLKIAKTKEGELLLGLHGDDIGLVQIESESGELNSLDLTFERLMML